MDFTDTPAEAAFRAEARAWLAAHAPAHELPVGIKIPDTEEADRGRFLIFREAEMGRNPLPPAQLQPLLDRLAALREDILALTKDPA